MTGKVIASRPVLWLFPISVIRPGETGTDKNATFLFRKFENFFESPGEGPRTAPGILCGGWGGEG